MADLGLSDIGATLAARSLVETNWVITNAIRDDPIYMLFAFLPADMLGPITFSVGGNLTGGHFPYGNVVEPYKRLP